VEGCLLCAEADIACFIRTPRRHVQLVCWDVEAKRLGGLEVDIQLNFCCLLYRQFGGLVAPENPAGTDAS